MKTIVTMSKGSYKKEGFSDEGLLLDDDEHDISLLKEDLSMLVADATGGHEASLLLEALRGAFKNIGARVIEFHSKNN